MDRLLAGAALAVDGRAGHFDREAGLEDDVAADVRGLLADLRDVAEDDVADFAVGSTPTWSTTARSTLRAERDRVRAESMPLRRPMPVRTALTMTTSRAKTSLLVAMPARAGERLLRRTAASAARYSAMM